ncbi:hypothetical protein LCGC14_2067770 [marine sediment metagenome]|uniref:Uncharacterized protein n=1 Tax=marine sediment metagenome TaxID=412755 RepID=A0A0F9GXS7_9ZZZZ
MSDQEAAKPVMGDHTNDLAGSGGESLESILRKGYGDPRFYALLKKMAILHGSKNKDYAQGGKQGHLGNFTRVSNIKRMYPGFDWGSPFGTAIDFLLKQLDAAMILYSIGRQSVTGENIPERLQDVSIYSGIATLLWQDEQPKLNIKPGGQVNVPKYSGIDYATDIHCPICGSSHYHDQLHTGREI